MIQAHCFNEEESRAVYSQCKNEIKPKECYMNIFRVLQHFPEKFRNKEWKVAYGYLQILENHHFLARHCFLLNQKGEAVDPTAVALKSFQANQMRTYISFQVYDHVEAYLESISQNDNQPDLVQHLLPMEQKYATPWAKENGYLIIG